MTTQAILSPANILAPAPAPAGANAATPSEAAEVPFSQVLQREVSERRGADQAAQADTKPSSEKSGKQDSAAQAADGAGKNEAVAGKDRKDTEKKEAKDEAGQLSDAANASSELIALVANMAQISSPAAEAKPVVADAAAGLDAAAPLGKPGKIALNAEEAHQKIQPGDVSPDTADLRGMRPDFAQAARDIPKDSGKSVPAQQFSMPQAAAAQPVAAPLDAPAAQAGSTLETAAIGAVSNLAPMQQALNKVQAATHAGDTLAPPVGTPAWDQAVGQKVVWMVAGAQQSASLTLNPPDLGPMQIVLNVNNAQANATFVAAQPEVRQALEAALPKLREMLGDAGIQLGQASISAGTPQHGNSAERDGRPGNSHSSQTENSEQTSAPVRAQAIRRGIGMVDTFA